MWTDTHTHLDKLKNPKEAKERALREGVRRLITIGTEFEDWPDVLKHTASPGVFGALGLHPHSADGFNRECEEFLREHLSQDSIVAVGEIGLDYHYERSPRDVQKKAFDRQLCLAEELDLPVEIHTRDAEEDTLAFLREFQGRVRGLLHCFTGSYEMARQALDCGFHISFSGIVTFKNSRDLQEVCKKIPLDCLHIETDAPYLSPAPHRGKENEPARLIHTARKVCELKDVEEQALSRRLEENVLKLFPKIQTGG